jgi:Protein of unknown function DUF262
MSIQAGAASLKNILSESKGITVPWYQRSYKWELKQIEEVFDDVLLFFGQNEGQSAFLGSIVFCPGRTGDDEIVDGQQRVTTLCMMVAVAASRLAAIKPDEPIVEEAFCLLWRDGATAPKLIHKDEDKVIFREIVSRIPGGVLDVIINQDRYPMNRVMDAQAFVKEKNVYQAYRIVQGMVDDAVASACESRSIDPHLALNQLLSVLLNQVTLVRIRANTHTDGVRIFEALNATGMPLEMDELIKSSFYMQASSLSPAVRDRVMDTWETGVGSVYSLMKTSSERNRFLRTYWMSREGFVVKNRLFDCFGERLARLVRNEGEAGLVAECASLAAAAEVYDMMVKESGRFACVSVQNDFLAVMYRVPMMALWLNSGLSGMLRDEAVMRVSMVLESVLVRMSICGQTTNSIEKAFSTIAMKISNRQLGFTPAEIELGIREYFADAAHQVPSDEIFFNYLRELQVQFKPRWRSIFARMDFAVKYPDASTYKHIVSTKSMDLDYMKLPFDKPSKAQTIAAGFSNVGEYEKGMSTLGNFVIVSRDTKERTNSPLNSIGGMTSLAGRDDIRKRSELLAQVAVKIWKV